MSARERTADRVDEVDPVVPCGHTDPVNGCECGDRVRDWWAETKRRLAEASPSRRFLVDDVVDADDVVDRGSDPVAGWWAETLPGMSTDCVCVHERGMT